MNNLRKRYNKPTNNLAGQHFVIPTVALTTDESISEFVANAVAGEVGIFVAEKNAAPHRIGAGGSPAYATTALASAGSYDKFYITQKHFTDPQITRTSAPLLHSKCKYTAIDHVANVRQVDTITFSSATLAATAVGQQFSITMRDTAVGSQMFPVEKYKFVSITGAETDEQIAQGVINDYERYLTSAYSPTDTYYNIGIRTDGTRSAFGQTSTYTYGSTTVTFGGNVTIATDSWIRLDSKDYKVKTGVTSGTTLELYTPFRGTSGVAVASATTTGGTLASITTFGFRIEARFPETNFVTSITNDLYGNATLTKTTAWVLGSGLDYAVIWVEEEAAKYAGNNHEYFERPSEHGQFKRFAAEGKSYDIIKIECTKTQDTKGNPEANRNITETVMLFIETTTPGSTGSTQYSALKTIFGL